MAGRSTSNQASLKMGAQVVARLGRLYTSTLSNALEDLGQDGCIVGLPPVAPGMRLAGRAMCVLQITGEAGAFPGSDFKVGAMIELQCESAPVANNEELSPWCLAKAAETSVAGR